MSVEREFVKHVNNKISDKAGTSRLPMAATTRPVVLITREFYARLIVNRPGESHDRNGRDVE